LKLNARAKFSQYLFISTKLITHRTLVKILDLGNNFFENIDKKHAKMCQVKMAFKIKCETEKIFQEMKSFTFLYFLYTYSIFQA